MPTEPSGAFTVVRIAILSCLAALLSTAPALEATAAESVYTDLLLDKCKSLIEPNPDEPGGDFMSSSCPGLDDYQVLFKEGDLRQSLHYGYLKKSIIDHAFESFGQFNNMNPKIEWRIGDDGKPYAAIQRFFVGDADNQGQVLAISRVGQPDDDEGCPVGYVDAIANKNPNELARQVADTIAINFECGKDCADYHGTRGPKAGDPMLFHGNDQQ
jgi:hypothetical protein